MQVALTGIHQTPFTGSSSQPYPEMIFEAARATLADAALSINEIDAVVFPMAPDALMGVAHAERWVAQAAGALGKPYFRVNTGGVTGLTAVQAAYQLIAAGYARRVLVVGADRVGESGDAQQILNRIWEPVFERSMPLNTVTMLAFQAVRSMWKYGFDERDMARVAVKNRANGARNPVAHLRSPVSLEDVLASRVVAWPYKLLDCCPKSSGAAGVVVCGEDAIPAGGPPPAWIRGIGHDSETYWMGDRMGPRRESDHAESPALTRAANRAYAAAGITDPRAELDFAELYAPFTSIELHAIHDVGLAAPTEVSSLLHAGAFDLDGSLPVNPSGGVLCANPISVTALVRVAEAALQVQGRAGEHQVAGARTGLATGIGGDHQFFGAVVVSADKEERSS